MSGNFATTSARAAAQQGRVASWQLSDAGIDRHAVQRWIEDGRLHRVYHGVYAVGHTAPSTRGDYMAAVLACGRDAVLSHRAAAYLMRLLRNAPAPPPEVTVPTTAGRRRRGIVIHRVGALHPLDSTTVDDIPIATAPRILLDLAPATPPAKLTRICHEAWVHHRVGPREVEECIARNPTKKGAARLRRALGSDVTLSRLETGFLALLRSHGLPLPRTNIDRRGDKVDCHWQQLDLTIELLSYRFHATREAFENDVARRRRSTHIAYTYGDVFERGASTITELRRLLLARAGAA